MNDDDDRAACASAIVTVPASGVFAPYQSLSLYLSGDQLGLWKPSPWETLRGPEKDAVRVATLISLGTAASQPALATLGLAQAGQMPELNYWSIANLEEVKTLDPLLSMRIRDGRGIPRGKEDATLELSAYLTMLRNTYETSDGAFRKVARELDRTRALTDPKACRGKVFRIAGQMRLLRRYDAPAVLRETVALADVYEGWIFDTKLMGNTPVCVLFTRLPDGLTPSEKMDVSVDFVGTYYKLLRYTSSEKGNPTRDCPLLMGQTVRLLSEPEEAEATESPANWARELLPIFLWTLVGAVGIVVVVSFWFRASDQAVRRRIAAARRTDFVPPGADENHPPADGASFAL